MHVHCTSEGDWTSENISQHAAVKPMKVIESSDLGETLALMWLFFFLSIFLLSLYRLLLTLQKLSMHRHANWPTLYNTSRTSCPPSRWKNYSNHQTSSETSDSVIRRSTYFLADKAIQRYSESADSISLLMEDSAANRAFGISLVIWTGLFCFSTQIFVSSYSKIHPPIKKITTYYWHAGFRSSVLKVGRRGDDALQL